MAIILLGFFIGVGAALLGLGGNIFIIPFLPLLTELSLSGTIATGILTVGLITLFNTLVYSRDKLIDWNVGLKVLPVMAITGLVGGELRNYVSEELMTLILVFVLFLMIIKLVYFSPEKQNLEISNNDVILFISSTFSGLMAGLVGIGNGVLLGPALLAFNLCNPRKVSPTINFLIFVNALFATIPQVFRGAFFTYQGGEVSLTIVASLFGAAVIGSLLGRKFNQKVEASLRKRIVAVVLSLVILKLAFD